MNNQLVLPLFKRHSTKAWVYIDNCNNVTTWADYFTSESLTCKRSADKQRKYVADSRWKHYSQAYVLTAG